MVGIGQGRITDNLATFVNDIAGAFTVPDEKSIQMVYELLDTEGLYLGASSALNVVAAVELALKLGKGEVSTLRGLASIQVCCRIECRHRPLRWRIPVPESAVFKEMAGKQRAGERYSGASKEICCIRLAGNFRLRRRHRQRDPIHGVEVVVRSKAIA